MHAAHTFLTTVVFTNGDIPKHPIRLTASQRGSLNNSLIQDAIGYAYSGIITLSESIIGVDHNFYSWATVKSYYSVFYFLRAILAVNGTAIFYCGRKPWILSSRSGEQPRKGKNNTHEMVLAEFRNNLQSHWLMSQPIGLIDPLTWMKNKRDNANYTIPRFIEPKTPDYFTAISTVGIRKAVTNYCQSANNFLAFDAAHAIISYPIQSLIHAITELKGIVGNQVFSEEDVRFLSTLCKDKSGPISDFQRLIR